MKILKRLLRITTIAAVAILAIHAGTALVLVILPDPQFKPNAGPFLTPEMNKMFEQVYAMAVRKPLLVIVGSKDEAFVADQFESVVTKYSAGQVVLVDGATHDGICYNDKAMAAAGNWLAKNGFVGANLSAR